MKHLIQPRILLIVALFAYGIVVWPFTSYMKHKPIEEKLGYFPNITVLKYSSADHKELVAAMLVMKVIMYYGGIADKQQSNMIVQPPDYPKMSAILHGATNLDPYNLDAYYFAQSFLSWEVKQYKIANDLLEYGMKYRTWDWMLPFFAGFNSAYFLKDYTKAAEFYKRAGELSGSELHFSLAGRYMQESGQTELAIMYLTAMEKNERNQAVKKNYQLRLAAFKEVRRVEVARDRYKGLHGSLPVSIDQLVSAGLLSPRPVDPYGGQFYIDAGGRIATTSKFAYAGAKQNKGGVGGSDERH